MGLASFLPLFIMYNGVGKVKTVSFKAGLCCMVLATIFLFASCGGGTITEDGEEVLSVNDTSGDTSDVGASDDTSDVGASSEEYERTDPIELTATESMEVTISLPDASILNDETLTLLSFYGSTAEFSKWRHYKSASIVVQSSSVPQVVLVLDSQDTPLFFSYLSTSGDPGVSIDNIAKGLLWMNPYVMILPPADRETFMAKASQLSLYTQLKNKTEDLLINDPKNLYNPDTHPELIKTAFILVKQTFEALGSEAPKVYKGLGATGDPGLSDETGNDVGFTNPKMVGYGVEVVDSAGVVTNVFIENIASSAEVEWGWPPKRSSSTPSMETVELADGSYNAAFYKGFNYSASPQYWWLPYLPGSADQISPNASIVGTATWYNTLLAVDLVVEAVSGESFKEYILSNILGRITASSSLKNGLGNLGLLLSSGNPHEVVGGVVDFLKGNWAEVSEIIWGDNAPNSRAFFVAADLLAKNMAKILKGVDWANEKIPYIYDIARAPVELNYCFEHLSGVITECSDSQPLIPPTASLNISTTRVYVGDEITLDASASTDDRTLNLQYIFDFDGDGAYDTVWSPNPTVTNTYTSPGIYNAIVTVKDEDGLTDTSNYYFRVYEQAEGVSTAIVIDKSGSMSGQKIIDAMDAAITFIGYYGTQDRGAIISFSTNISVDQSFTDDTTLLTDAISFSAAGGTHLNDAIYEGIAQTVSEDSTRRRAVVVLTDGYGGGSSHSKSDVVDYAVDNSIPVYTIGLGDSVDQTLLEDIATQTGGLFFLAPTGSDLQDVYDTISIIQ